MRREYPAISQKGSLLTIMENSTPPVVINVANSWEVLRGYYLEKIQELNTRLLELNLMENAREITALCHEIIRAKQALYKLNVKTGYLA